MLGLLYDAVDSVESFVRVFIYVYTLLILAYIITMWVRLPYSAWRRIGVSWRFLLESTNFDLESK